MSSNFQSKSFKILINFIIYIFIFNTQAQEQQEKIESLQVLEQNETLEQKFISSNKAISNWFDSLAEGIDLFLVGKQLHTTQNDTSVKITNSTYASEGKNALNQTAIAINPRFPNLEKYWNLKFTNYDEQEDERDSENKILRQTPRETNYGATIGLFRRFGNVRTAFQPRIELQSPLNVSHSLSFESVADFETFKFNPKLNLFAHATIGTGISQSLNFNFELTPIFSLTLINEGTYEEKLHKYSVHNGISIGQSISSINAMSYSLLFTSNNRENYHLDSYSISTTWYHLFYKQILDLQLTPHLDYLQSENFSGHAGLTLQLNLRF